MTAMTFTSDQFQFEIPNGISPLNPVMATAEAADLGIAPGDQLAGFTLVSDFTAETIELVLDEVLVKSGDITGWTYRPSDQAIAAEPRCATLLITIYND